MAKGIFCVPDVEHEGDIDHYTSLIIDNGGEIERVVWSGEEYDNAYIVFIVPTEEDVRNMKLFLYDN